MAIEIVLTHKLKVKKPVLIEGFPGIGLVGTISSSFLVEKFQLEPLGYIASEKFPPITAVHNYTPLHPARLYQSKKHNLVVLFAEFVIPIKAVHELSRVIMTWAKKNKVKEIISMGGIGIKGDQDEVYGIASTPELSKKLEKIGVKLIKEGATTGVAGVLMSECAVDGYPAVSLLAESKPDVLDPRGAALVLAALAKYTGLKIDVNELISEADSIETKIKDILDNAKTSHEHYQQTSDMGPMYG